MVLVPSGEVIHKEVPGEAAPWKASLLLATQQGRNSWARCKSLTKQAHGDEEKKPPPPTASLRTLC